MTWSPEYTRAWKEKNREALNKKRRDEYANGRWRPSAAQKKLRARRRLKWVQEHREQNRAYLREYARKRRNDPAFKVKKSVSDRVREALKGRKKPESASFLLGCPIQTAVEYIEALFKPGMSWDNHGDWHIDHVLPLASFDLMDPDQLAQACHYTNLQPLWAHENMSKGAKIMPASALTPV